MKKKLLNASRGYSLLELIATVTILVALATVMLPAVSVNKKSIYNSTESYNLSGTQRYLEMFNSLYRGADGTIGAYNCYPNAFSTGIAANVDPATTAVPAAGRLSLDTISLLSNGAIGGVTVAAANIDNSGDTTVITCGNITTAGGANPMSIANPAPLSIANAISLFKAGITTLNYGNAGNWNFTLAATVGAQGLAQLTTPVADTTADYATNLTYVIKYPANTLTAIESGCFINKAAPTTLVPGTKIPTLLGYTSDNWDLLCNNVADDIVFLFVTPNMNWTEYHADAKYVAAVADLTFSYQVEKSAQVAVPVPAGSPWMPVDSYRYYIAVFDVDNGATTAALTLYAAATDATTVAELKGIAPARLLGVLSPANLSTATP